MLMNQEVFQKVLDENLEAVKLPKVKIPDGIFIESLELDVESEFPLETIGILQQQGIFGLVMTHTIVDEDENVISLVEDEDEEKIEAVILLTKELIIIDGHLYVIEK